MKIECKLVKKRDLNPIESILYNCKQSSKQANVNWILVNAELCPLNI